MYATKEKQAEYDKRWKSKNRESINVTRNQRRRELLDWIWQYKENHPCSRCGQSHPAALDFHHLANKDFEVSRMPSMGYSLERIQKEIDKCVVLCASCHRITHYEENNVPVAS